MRVCDYARSEGVWLRPLGNVIVIMPPLAISAGAARPNRRRGRAGNSTGNGGRLTASAVRHYTQTRGKALVADPTGAISWTPYPSFIRNT